MAAQSALNLRTCATATCSRAQCTVRSLDSRGRGVQPRAAAVCNFAASPFTVSQRMVVTLAQVRLSARATPRRAQHLPPHRPQRHPQRRLRPRRLSTATCPTLAPGATVPKYVAAGCKRAHARCCVSLRTVVPRAPASKKSATATRDRAPCTAHSLHSRGARAPCPAVVASRSSTTLYTVRLRMAAMNAPPPTSAYATSVCVRRHSPRLHQRWHPQRRRHQCPSTVSCRSSASGAHAALFVAAEYRHAPAL